jgi:hypothetical protein
MQGIDDQLISEITLGRLLSIDSVARFVGGWNPSIRWIVNYQIHTELQAGESFSIPEHGIMNQPISRDILVRRSSKGDDPYSSSLLLFYAIRKIVEIKCAEYYEGAGQFDKSAGIYQKYGLTSDSERVLTKARSFNIGDKGTESTDPMQILKTRYVKGEISEEEYEKMKRKLNER